MAQQQHNEAVARAREAIAKKAATVQRVLATPDGQELMKLLREEFLYRAQNECHHGAAFRLGQADVVGYLMQMNDFKETI